MKKSQGAKPGLFFKIINLGAMRFYGIMLRLLISVILTVTSYSF